MRRLLRSRLWLFGFVVGLGAVRLDICWHRA